MPQPSIHWYVVRAKPHRERVVCQQLVQQGFEMFFPTARVHPVNPRAARERAYFPGYLFIHVDLQAIGPSRLNWIPGGLGLLEFGGEPAIVPDVLITQLKRRVATIHAAGGLVLSDLKRGDRVKIISGPLAGYEAVFDLRLKGAERVRILLDFLRKRTAVEIDTGAIRKIR